MLMNSRWDNLRNMTPADRIPPENENILTSSKFHLPL